LGPQSPIKLARTLNGFAAQSWYYVQLRRIAAGEPLALSMNPLAAFLAEARDAKTRI